MTKTKISNEVNTESETMEKKHHTRSRQQNIVLFNYLNDETINLEDCIIVWLDLQRHARSHHIETLRSIVNYLKIFDDVENCVGYVSAVAQERVFLIVSGQTGEHVVPILHHLIQLHSIYIFCINDEKHKKWSSKYTKVQGVFINEKSLYDHLHRDVLLCSTQTPISIIPIEQTSHALNSTEKPSYLWSQVLLQVLLRLPASNTSKQDMISQARDQYKNNIIEQRKIDDFEKTYSSDSVIQWYTRDSFVYRLVNKALRTENIDNIFVYRFFIADLYAKLAQLHSNYIATCNSKTLTVYRGQLMSMLEFEKIKSSINQCISINTFFSTSESSAVAVDFFAGASYRPVAECVLFEILVDTTAQMKPFAIINQWSCNENEKEVLFTMGTIFKIESCEEFNEDFWHVKLILSTEPDERIKQLLDHYHTHIGERSSLLLLGELLHKMNELDKAERYYQLLTRELPENHVDIGMALNNVGTIYTDRGQYKRAKTYLRKALCLYRQILPKCHLNVAEIYLNLASVYSNMECVNIALKYEKKALKIQLEILPINHLTLATTYNNIGHSYYSLNKSKNALKYYEKAFSIELQHLPENHPDVATTYNNMASVFIDIHDYRSAREHLNKAIEIRKETLTLSHPDIADTYRLMGIVSEEIDETEDALEKYQEALRILMTAPVNSLDHHRISQLHTDLGLLFAKRKFPGSALRAFKKCLYHLKQCEFANLHDISTVYNHIATVYIDTEKFEKAKIYCRRSLKIQRKDQNGSQCRTWFNSYSIMAEVLRGEKRNNKALKILKTLIDHQHLLPSNDLDAICDIYKTIALLYAYKKCYKKSIIYIKKSIEAQLRFSSDAKINLGFSYNHLGTMYSEIKMPRRAIKWYRKAITIYLKAEPSPVTYLADSYHFLGETMLDIDKHLEAKSYLVQALNLRLSNLSTNDIHIAETYIVLGKLENSRKRYRTAIKYYRRALSIHKQQQNPAYADLIDLHNLLGASLSNKQNTNKGMNHWRRALQLDKERKSLSANQNERIGVMIAAVYRNIARTHLDNDKNSEALMKLKKSLAILRQYSESLHYFNLSMTLLFIGTVLRKKERYRQALVYLHEAHRLLETYSQNEHTELLSTVYTEIGLCYHHLGDRHHQKAYHFYELVSNTCLVEDNTNFRHKMQQTLTNLQKQYTAKTVLDVLQS